MHEGEKWKWSRSVLSDSERPHGLQPSGLLHPWDFPGKSTAVGCHRLIWLWVPHKFLLLAWESFLLFKVLLRLFFLFYFILFLNLKHCISFAKHQNEFATGIHTLPILNPSPSSLPTPFLWVVPVHQPQASSILHRTWTGNSFHTWYYTCFNAILPNLPTLFLSNRVHKTVLYISVSFAVSLT